MECRRGLGPPGTPEVELNPRCDINDVYAFPGSTDDRIVLVMTTSSPIVPATAASFDNDKLYQIKIDNDDPGDGVEDLVLQFTFSGDGASQQVSLRGPVAPVNTGTANRLSPSDPTVTGTTRTLARRPTSSSSRACGTTHSSSTSSSSSASSLTAGR